MISGYPIMYAMIIANMQLYGTRFSVQRKQCGGCRKTIWGIGKWQELMNHQDVPQARRHTGRTI
jgi:hypothetical protein